MYDAPHIANDYIHDSTRNYGCRAFSTLKIKAEVRHKKKKFVIL